MLKRVSIQNFKSLKDVTLDLQKVNLLIGPNNSGKTNFLKALEFFKLSVFDYDLTAESQIPQLTYKRSAKYVSIEVSIEDNNRELIFLREYKFEPRPEATSSQRTLVDGVVTAYNDTGYPDASILRRVLGRVIIYRPDPNRLIQPGPTNEKEAIVKSDASNLIGFFDRLRDEHTPNFEQIKSDLNKCIPEFTDINFQLATPDNEQIRNSDQSTFKRLGLTHGKQGVKYWADELSEGTLYFLALLCIINQPNPPKLLLLEEPEKGIHPRRIREVMDFIFRLAEEKDIQIILTTHNEHVLDDFATRPESVFVFDKDDEGATYVRNLQTDIIEPTNQRNAELGLDPVDLTTNLSDNWIYGLLGGVPPVA